MLHRIGAIAPSSRGLALPPCSSMLTTACCPFPSECRRRGGARPLAGLAGGLAARVSNYALLEAPQRARSAR